VELADRDDGYLRFLTITVISNRSNILRDSNPNSSFCTSSEICTNDVTKDFQTLSENFLAFQTLSENFQTMSENVSAFQPACGETIIPNLRVESLVINKNQAQAWMTTTSTIIYGREFAGRCPFGKLE
jgi:hypothetical protein